MVLRLKSFHANTGGEDHGLKDWMQHIEFYDPSANVGGTTFPLAVAKAVEKGLPVALSKTKDGKRVLMVAKNGQWHPAKISDVFKYVATTDDYIVSAYSTTPKLNWNPMDYNLRSNGTISSVHPGSPVSHGVKLTQTTNECASGYIPSEKEKNDPRFKTALTVDIKPDTMKKNAKAFGNKISRAGIPPTANPNGKF